MVFLNLYSSLNKICYRNALNYVIPYADNLQIFFCIHKTFWIIYKHRRLLLVTFSLFFFFMVTFIQNDTLVNFCLWRREQVEFSVRKRIEHEHKPWDRKFSCESFVRFINKNLNDSYILTSIQFQEKKINTSIHRATLHLHKPFMTTVYKPELTFHSHIINILCH